ncbi:DEAD/DEAH box helicase (plasmid) [Pseudoalteromonas espejiana]
MNFKSFSFAPELIQALDELNYHTLTPIQRSAIPAVRKGKDVLASAQTGTGKKTARRCFTYHQKLFESEHSTTNARCISTYANA